MKNTHHKKQGALFRAPIIRAINVLAVTAAVIGMVTYVGLYNPRAGLASTKSPPDKSSATARAAPASKPGDLNGDNKVNALDLSMYLSSQNHQGVAASEGSKHNLALETEMATIIYHYTW